MSEIGRARSGVGSAWRRCFTLLVLLVTAALAAPGARAEIARAPLGRASGSDLIAVQGNDRRLHVEALPRSGEGLVAFVIRLCGSGEARQQVASANGGATRLERGVRYRVPFSCLRPELQLQTLEALFPEDVMEPAGWRHRVDGRPGTPPAELWTLAEIFTGRGEDFRELRGANQLADEAIYAGQEILIPRTLLRPALRAALPRPEEGASPLVYARDEKGEYAVYRLQRGEALYSSVVVRFTGRIFAEDVTAMAAEIAERSAIADVTDIPIGYPVRIPLEDLSPEHLPAGHPRRQEYERDLAESAGYANLVRSRNLEGVTVILDAGHGGRDVGASIEGVWESVYAYDVAVRVRRLLEQTAASTVMTTRDGGEWTVAERDVLASSRGHAVLSTPPYVIADSRVSTNLRWYVSNSVFGKTVSTGGDPDKVVFLSMHADSLHPSVRGAMMYVPGLLSNPSQYGKTGTIYASRREVQERPRVDFAYADRKRSEGLSRDLAGHMIESMRRRGIAIHPQKPIRDRVIRGKRAWVPAVLRWNAVPAKILIEVCNLANPTDRRLIQTRAFREEVARAIVEGLLAYYGVEPGDPRDGQVAARTAG